MQSILSPTRPPLENLNSSMVAVRSKHASSAPPLNPSCASGHKFPQELSAESFQTDAMHCREQTAPIQGRLSSRALGETAARFVDAAPSRRLAQAGLIAGTALWFLAWRLKGTEHAATIPFLTQNYGDFIWPAMLAKLPHDLLRGLGNSRSLFAASRFLRSRAAELSVGLGLAYVTLGETVLPALIPMGTPDPLDVPMAAAGALLAYLGYFRWLRGASDPSATPLFELIGGKIRSALGKLFPQ